ncbi:MAG: hypothetical protein ACJ786_35380 [Catenulispora sp.]
MTQQPNQNYPQPGGWGQQQPAPQPGQQQWGAAQPSYGQPQPAQQYGGGTPAYGGASPAGGDSWGKMWGFYAAGALAVITAVLALVLAWASVKLDIAGQSFTINVTATGHGSASGAQGSDSGKVPGYPSIWGILIIIAAVIAAVGVGLVMWQKKAVMGWIVVAGSGLALIFAILAGLMGHNKLKDELVTGADAPTGAHYSLQMLGIGAWIGIVALLIGTVLAVLAQLSVNAGGASAGAGGSAQPWQQAGYGQPQYGQAGNAPAYNPQGQPQAQPWGGQPAQGQQQWGNPQPPQQGQPQWGGQGGHYDPAAHQPTQAVQPGFMPPQQPPQQPR